MTETDMVNALAEGSEYFQGVALGFTGRHEHHDALVAAAEDDDDLAKGYVDGRAYAEGHRFNFSGRRAEKLTRAEQRQLRRRGGR